MPNVLSKLKLYPNDKSPDGYLLDIIAPGMSKAVRYQYAQAMPYPYGGSYAQAAPYGGSNGGLFGEKKDMDALAEHIKGLLNSEGLSSKETIEIFFGENNYSKRALEGFCEYLASNQGSVDGFAVHFQQDITRSMQKLPNGAFDIPAAPSLSSFKAFDTMSNAPAPEQMKIKANLNIVYDLAAVFESEDDVRKQIEHYLKAGAEQLIGYGMITGALPVYLDEHDIQVDLSETLTGLDEKTLHCNLILDACFSIAEPDCQPLSCYAGELSENLESIFAHMSAEGMMSDFSDTLIVDDWKVTIDHGQPIPNNSVQRDEPSM